MKVAHAWVIPDQGLMRGGVLYDRWGNLEYFADTTGLTDKTSTGAEKSVAVKPSTAVRWMRDPAPYTRQATGYNRVFGGGRNKGALPGYTVTFVSDAGTVSEEVREFQYTGTLSAFTTWLKTTAKFQVDVYGPSGALNASVPGASP